jgi:hypothetical protein
VIDLDLLAGLDGGAALVVRGCFAELLVLLERDNDAVAPYPGAAPRALASPAGASLIRQRRPGCSE